MFQLVPVFSLLIFGMSSSAAAENVASDHDGAVQRLSRYQILLLGVREVQRDLLAVPVKIEFGDEVRTVGEAIALLIEGSGYRIAEVDPQVLCRQAVFKLPLPQVHRKLEGLTLRQGLEVLVGPGYRPVIDEVDRSFSVERVRPEPAMVPEGCSCE